MALFGRKNKARTEPDPVDEADDWEDDQAELTRGPQDSGGAPAPDGYLDLGTLYVPRIRGMQLRGNFEADKETMRRVVLVLGSSGVAVSVAAAPRSTEAWPELADQIKAGIVNSGGTIDEVGGPYGLQLEAKVATQLPDGSTGLAPLRIIGCEGSGWLLRIDVQGAAAQGDEEQMKACEDLIDRLIVNRGNEPKIRFELLPLRLPKEAAPSDGSE